MPTASSFTFTFPWKEMVGSFNTFIPMFTTPLALAVGIIITLMFIGVAIDIIKKAKSRKSAV